MLKPQLQAEKEFHLQDTGWKEGIQLSDFLMQKVKAVYLRMVFTDKGSLDFFTITVNTIPIRTIATIGINFFLFFISHHLHQ